MKSVLILFLCSFLALSVQAQSAPTEKPLEVAVAEIALARDDGKGNPGELTDKFSTDDAPIHCLIRLNSTEKATVKMILVAVKAAGLLPETKSISVSYTTRGNEDGVNFHASPAKGWQPGDYRVDVFVNGKLSKSLAFEIAKSTTDAKLEKQIAPKNFAPPKRSVKSRKN